MAHINWHEEKNKKQSREKYNDLKNHLNSKTPSGGINEFYLATIHMKYMEDKIVKQEVQIKKYREFFSSLKSLLPNDI